MKSYPTYSREVSLALIPKVNKNRVCKTYNKLIIPMKKAINKHVANKI